MTAAELVSAVLSMRVGSDCPPAERIRARTHQLSAIRRNADKVGHPLGPSAIRLVDSLQTRLCDIHGKLGGSIPAGASGPRTGFLFSVADAFIAGFLRSLGAKVIVVSGRGTRPSGRGRLEDAT